MMVTKNGTEDAISSLATTILAAVLVGVVFGTFGLPIMFSVVVYGPPTVDGACPEYMDADQAGTCKWLWGFITNHWWVSLLAGILLGCMRQIRFIIRAAARRGCVCR